MSSSPRTACRGVNPSSTQSGVTRNSSVNHEPDTFSPWLVSWIVAEALERFVERHGAGAEVAERPPATAVRGVEQHDLIAVAVKRSRANGSPERRANRL